MAMTKYLINKDVTGPFEFSRTVEANSYRIADGFFHFYEGFGTDAEKIFSMSASKVHIIEVTKP